MSRRSNRFSNVGGGRTTLETEEIDTESMKGGTRTTTTTTTSWQQVVTRHSGAGSSMYNYEMEPWEATPKTDYTYSRTRSYLKQPPSENYIHPNMSRLGLRRDSASGTNGYSSNTLDYNQMNTNDMNLVRNLSLDTSFNGGNGGGGNLDREDEIQQSSSSYKLSQGPSDDVYMTQRSRTLMSHNQQHPGGWQTDNTFQMRNLLGTDVEEEYSDTESSYDQYQTQKKQRVAVTSNSNVFSHFFQLIVVTVVSVVTFIPRKIVSTTTSLISGTSKADRNHVANRVQTSSSTTTTTTTAGVHHSKWRTVQRAVSSAAVFTVVTLPVGLASWAAYGVISVAKFIGRSSMKVWHVFEHILSSTITKGSRIVNAAVLSRTSALRRRCGCPCLLLLLFLIPLLLFGLLYANSCRSEAIAIGTTGYDRISLFLLPLFARETINVTKVEIVKPPDVHISGTTNIKRDDMGLVELEQRLRDLIMVLVADQKKAARDEQNEAFSKFQLELDQLVKVIVDRQLQVQNNFWTTETDSIKTSTGNKHADLVAEQEKQMLAVKALRGSLDDLTLKANSLSDELGTLRASVADRSQPQPANKLMIDLDDHVKNLNAELAQLKTKYDELTIQISKWPSDEQTATLIRTRIREYFIQMMKTDSAGDLLSLSDADVENKDVHLPFAAWLEKRYAGPGDLSATLASLSANITKEINDKILAAREDPANIAAAAAAIISEARQKEESNRKDNSGHAGAVVSTGDTALQIKCCDGLLKEADVLKLIHAELGIYDADKTGKVDYALESAGGSVISVRCSQTYQLQTAQTSIFGIPLWYTYNSPRVIIQPGANPGECWAFTGSQGYVVVQLARQIYVKEVSIEHIPKSLSPTGKILSAPKDFEVWGLANESDTTGEKLGSFTYESEGTPIQTFQINSPMWFPSFRFIELKINSNHGHESYTCLYRFRVHGVLDPNAA